MSTSAKVVRVGERLVLTARPILAGNGVTPEGRYFWQVPKPGVVGIDGGADQQSVILVGLTPGMTRVHCEFETHRAIVTVVCVPPADRVVGLEILDSQEQGDLP